MFPALLSAALLCTTLAGCSQGTATQQSKEAATEGTGLQGAYEDEILTTTPVDQDKTMITVRMESGIAQAGSLERVLEEKFPNVDIVLVHDGSLNSLYTIRADLEADVACDLLLSRRLDTLGEDAKDYLLDLSSESFVDNYYLTAIDSCLDSEGNLYYLPGPSDFYGIVYDKTMFEENGWQVPHSYSEFVELLNTIRNSGLTGTVTEEDGTTRTVPVEPYMNSIMYPDSFQIQFNTYSYNLAFTGADNFRWLMDYQTGNGSMVGHLEPAAERFQQLFTDGVLNADAWTTAPKERSNAMYIYHTAAMITECENAITYNQTFTKDAGVTAHEIGMMPFWTSDEPDSDYLYVIPSYYLGISKQAAEESADKKAVLLDILGYLSSVEGQEALFADSGNLQMSNVQDVPLENTGFTAEVLETISEGRLINTFYYANGEDNKQVERQMLSTAPDMVSGSLSVDAWLQQADQARDAFLDGGEPEEVYGQVETTLTRLESNYTLAEMYKDLTGADIGISHGGAWRDGVNGYFYAGDITDTTLGCVTPNKESKSELTSPMDEKIVVTSLTGQQVLDILNSVGNTDDTIGQYPYFVAAGLTVAFNPWAGEGQRVLSCKLPDGSDIDPSATYQVSYYNESLSYFNIQGDLALDGTWQDNFLSWLDQQGGVIKKPDMTLELAYSIP
jgi:ABC-type glycerol-3-phosphate transport system substrate-binding protein